MSRKRYTEEFKVEAGRQVTERGHSVPDVPEKLVQGGTLAERYVVHLVHGGLAGGAGREQVGLDAVVDVAEVPAGFSVTIYSGSFPIYEPGKPLWNHCGIGAVWILAFTENIKIP